MTTPIPSFPVIPHRLMSESDFANAGDDLLGRFPAFVAALNAFGPEMEAVGEIAQQALAAGLAGAANNATLASQKAEEAGISANQATNAAQLAQEAAESIAMGPVASINGQGGHVTLKSVGGLSLLGEGDIPLGAGNAAVQTISADLALTYQSAKVQSISATAENLCIILPNATTLPKGGVLFVLENPGVIPLGVRDFTGAFKTVIQPGQIAVCYLKDNSTAAGVWAFGSEKGGDLGGVLSHMATAVLNQSSAPNDMSVIHLTDTTAVFLATNGTTTLYAYVLIIDGTSISVGAQNAFTVIYTGGVPKAIRLNDTQLLVTYPDTSSTTAIDVLTVFDGMVALGTPVQVSLSYQPHAIYARAVARLSDTQAVVAGANTGGNATYIAVVTVTDTTCAVGSWVQEASVTSVNYPELVVVAPTLCMLAFSYGTTSSRIRYYSISGTTLVSGTYLAPTQLNAGLQTPVAFMKLSDDTLLISFGYVTASSISAVALVKYVPNYTGNYAWALLDYVTVPRTLSAVLSCLLSPLDNTSVLLSTSDTSFNYQRDLYKIGIAGSALSIKPLGSVPTYVVSNGVDAASLLNNKLLMATNINTTATFACVVEVV